MPSDRVARCFTDIIAAIDLIQIWVSEAGGAEHAILRDPLVRSAIERQLLIISEAAIRMDKLDAAVPAVLAPEIDWQGIRGIGNFLRHRYDDLDSAILVDVVRDRLATLRAAAERAVTARQAR
jgi:uncharacterized protein with HEPN domain